MFDRPPTPSETAGIIWWNELTEHERQAWCSRAGSPSPADAWACYSAERASLYTAVGDEVAPKRGRGRPRVHADEAARKAAHRARHGTRQLNVDLPADLFDRLDAYVTRQSMDGAGLTRAQIIAKLIDGQLLRKR